MSEAAAVGATAATRSANGGLVVKGLEVGYGRSKALFGVDLTATGGSVVAVLGANGAGKSTLGRSVSGLVPSQAGTVWFDGVEITGRPAHKVRRGGLTYIPEGRGIFPGLSVVDNMRMAVRQLPKREREAATQNVFAMFPVLGQRLTQRAGSLSGGEQQMLAMGRALSVSPKLIVADEMSLGLAPKMVETVFDSLEKAREAGITIVLIEQFVHRALAFANTCLILSRGVVGWAGDAGDAGGEVLDRYLGDAGSPT